MKVMKWVCQSTCDCEKITGDEYRMARAAVLEEILNNNYHFTELYHNFGKTGTPLMDNGKIFCANNFDWGQLMADAYPEEGNWTRWCIGPLEKFNCKFLRTDKYDIYPE